jgi:hypothetical protein
LQIKVKPGSDASGPDACFSLPGEYAGNAGDIHYSTTRLNSNRVYHTQALLPEEGRDMQPLISLGGIDLSSRNGAVHISVEYQ